MILTDREIQLSIQRGLILIDPPPQPVAYSSTSIDLTLDPHISEFNRNPSYLRNVIDPTHQDYDTDEALKQITTTKEIDHSNGYELKCDELVLAWTSEYVSLPLDTRVAARVEGKSSLARLGVAVHMTAPTIHAGFKGQIRLEIRNYGHVPVLLKPGMRICQLIFEMTLGTPIGAQVSQFQGQIAV